MTLRIRFTIAAAVAAGIAVLGVATVGVTVTRWRLRTEVDNSLVSQAMQIARSSLVSDTGGFRRNGGGRPDHGGDQNLQAEVGAFQVIDENGEIVVQRAFVEPLPIDSVDKAIAAGTSDAMLRDRTTDDAHVRVATVPAGNGLAVQVERPIDDIDRTISSLVLAFVFIGLAGIALGGGIGFVVAGRALAPVKRLGAAAEEVAERQDPGLPVPETGGAELVSLGHSINLMLASLDDARQHERRLIDDAAHELRTPLTSLRTNIEVLSSGRPIMFVDTVFMPASLQAANALSTWALLIWRFRTSERSFSLPLSIPMQTTAQPMFCSSSATSSFMKFTRELQMKGIPMRCR